MIVTKKHIALLFLFLFISFKSLGFHSIIHDEEDITDCTLCEYVLETTKIKIAILDDFSLEEEDYLDFKILIYSTYNYTYTDKLALYYSFYRPPPSLY